MNCTLRAMAIGVASEKAIAHIAAMDIFARNFDGIALQRTTQSEKINNRNEKLQNIIPLCHLQDNVI